MNHLRLTIPLLCLLVAAPALADAPVGVWTGKLGRARVVACFDSDSGSYYYAKIGVDIPLVDKGAGAWEEKKGDKAPTGTWQLSPSKDEMLAGTWKSPDGKRELPIALKSSGNPSDMACPSPAYNAARVAAVVRTPGKQATKVGLTTRAFAALAGNVTGLEIVGADAALVPVRRAVEKLNRELLGRYFDCMTFGAAAGVETDFSGEVALVGITQHFLVVRQSAGYWCGGAHPDDDDAFLILSRKSGEATDLESWLKVSADAIGLAHWKNSEEGCKEAVSESTSFLVWPTAAGMVFRPVLPHVNTACVEDVTVPYAQLAGKLTQAGKRAITEFAGAAK